VEEAEQNGMEGESGEGGDERTTEERDAPGQALEQPAALSLTHEPVRAEAARGGRGAARENAEGVQENGVTHEQPAAAAHKHESASAPSPPAVPALRLPVSAPVDGDGDGARAGEAASGRNQESDPVLERAERAMNILDDYIMKSARKADPVLDRAERGLHVHSLA
jgi:hypothetical protein